MRLWSSKRLEFELAHALLPEREKLKYFILPLVLAALLGSPIFLITPNYGIKPSPLESVFILLRGLLMCMALYFGIRMSYRENKKIDNRNFIERYAILSVPVFIKFLCIVLPVQALIMIIFNSVIDSYPRINSFVSCFMQLSIPLFYLWFFYLIAQSFKRFGMLLLKNNTKKDMDSYNQ